MYSYVNTFITNTQVHEGTEVDVLANTHTHTLPVHSTSTVLPNRGGTSDFSKQSFITYFEKIKSRTDVG